MNTLSYLSKLTGYSLEELDNALNLGPCAMVSEANLVRLCTLYGRVKLQRPNPIILLIDNKLYKGIILGKFAHHTNYPYKEGVKVMYHDIDNNIKFAGLYACGEKYQDESAKIQGFPIKTKTEDWNLNPEPLDCFYDIVTEAENVSIGHISDGYFFVNSQGERVSVFFESIVIDPAGIYVIKLNNFYGLADSQGNIIQYPSYSEIKPFSEGLAAFKDIYSWGYMNLKGEIVISPQYSTAENFNDGVAVVTMYLQDGKIKGQEGFINAKGNAIIIEDGIVEYPEFSFVAKENSITRGIKHSSTKIAAGKNRDIYYIPENDISSDIILGTPNIFPSNENYSDWRTIYNIKTKLMGLISRDWSQIIPCSFKSILKRTRTLVVGEVPSVCTSFTIIKDTDEEWKQMSLMTTNTAESLELSSMDNFGNWLFPRNNNFADSYRYTRCVQIKIVEITNEDEKEEHAIVYYVSHNNHYGLVDSENKELIPIIFDEIVLPSAHKSYSYEYDYDREWLNYKGRESYVSVRYSFEQSPDSFIYARKNGEWSIYTYKGELLSDIHFIDVFSIADLFILKGTTGYGIINQRDFVAPCKYDDIDVRVIKGTYGINKILCRVYQEKKQGLYIFCPYSKDREYYCIDTQYNSIEVINDKVIVSNPKLGVISFSGKEIIPLVYDSITHIADNDAFIVLRNNHKGVLDNAGNIVVPVEFKDVKFSNNVYYLTSNDNLEGVWAIAPCEYDSIESMGQCFVGKKEGQNYFISSNGTVVLSVDSCDRLDNIKTANGRIVYGRAEFLANPFKPFKVYYPATSGLYLIENNNKKGVVNNDGRIIIPIECQDVGLLCPELILVSDGQSMHLVSIDGLVKSESYDCVEIASSYRAENKYPVLYVQKDTKLGLLSYQDSSFIEEIPCIFDTLVIGDKYTLYKNRCTIDSVPISEKILGSDGYYKELSSDLLWSTDFSFLGIAIAVRGDKFGLINESFNDIKECKYKNIIKLDAFHYLLSINSETHLICFDRSFNDRTLQTIKCTIVRRIANNLFSIEKDKKFGMLRYDRETEKLEYITEIIYDSIIVLNSDFIQVNLAGQYGCFDTKGELVLPAEYNSIVPLSTKFKGWGKDVYAPRLSEHILIASIALDGMHLLYNYETHNKLEIDFERIEVSYLSDYNTGHGAYIQYYKDGKSGVISLDCSRYSGGFDEISINYQYSKGSGFYARSDNKWGYIDYNSFDMIPCRFSNKVSFAESTHRLWINENGQLYDSKTKRVIPITGFKSIELFADGIWKVSYYRSESLMVGLYDDAFEIIVPPDFHDITIGLDNQYIASINKGKYESGYGVKAISIYDRTGAVLFPLSKGRISFYSTDKPYYEYVHDDIISKSFDGIRFENDNISYKEYLFDSYNHFYSGDNENGTRNVMTSFGTEYYFVEDAYTNKDITILKISGKFIAVNSQKEITTKPYEKITLNSTSEYLQLIDGTNRKFVDYQGNYLGEIKGDFTACVFERSVNLIKAINTINGKRKEYKLYSNTGQQLNNTAFSFIGTFFEGFATCVINSPKAIDKDFFKSVRDEWFFQHTRDTYGQWGLINDKGEIVIPMKFDFIRPVKNGLTVFVKECKWGVINPVKRNSSAAIYKNLLYFTEGLCRCRKFSDSDVNWQYSYSHCGFIDESGRECISPIYQNATPFKNGKATVHSKDGFVNQIDKEGNLLNEWKLKRTNIVDAYYDDNDSGYTQSDLDDMYRSAFEGDSSAQWNID